MFRLRWLRGRSRPTTKPVQSQGEPVTRFTACTYCHSEEFYEGPSGGVSQNIKCAKCGARFNIGLIPGGPILLDKLSPPTEEPYASHTKPTAT